MDERAKQAGHPQGDAGRATLTRMNDSHKPLCDWAFSTLTAPADAHALDVGCGGGAVVARLLKQCPQGHVDGIDISTVGVLMSAEANEQAIEQGRCTICLGSVDELPYPDASFDLVTACETIYFWPDCDRAFGEVLRVLKPGGTFAIICEMSDAANPAWIELLDGFDEMTVYTGLQLKTALDDAGFTAATLSEGTGEWICVTGQRPRA